MYKRSLESLSLSFRKHFKNPVLYIIQLSIYIIFWRRQGYCHTLYKNVQSISRFVWRLALLKIFIIFTVFLIFWAYITLYKLSLVGCFSSAKKTGRLSLMVQIRINIEKLPQFYVLRSYVPWHLVRIISGIQNKKSCKVWFSFLMLQLKFPIIMTFILTLYWRRSLPPTQLSNGY